jgi:DNA-binding IclR family transcriptional regulator
MAIGQRLPMAPPVGSVFLAWSAPDDVDRWLSRAAEPLSDDERAQQRQVLDVVRSRGYAVAFETVIRRQLGSELARQVDDDKLAGDIAQRLTEMAHAPYHLSVIEPERTYDVGMVAAPIFDTHRAVVAAVTLSGFNPDVPGHEVTAVGERLLGTARVITKRSGGRMPAELD